MKAIKYLSLAALSATMVACDKDDPENNNVFVSDYRSIAVSDLPAPVTNHVSASFPSSSIVGAEMDASMGYEVEINQGWELYYDLDGNHLHTESLSSSDDDVPVPVSSLPQSIINYVNANYPNEYIVWAEYDDGEYEIYLSNGMELYFDISGNFLYADDDDQDIDPANLPTTITNYISQNYPNLTIVEAELDDNVYEIYLSNGLELYFDSNGNFIGLDMDDMPVDPATLPTSITNYLQQNYPNDSIVSAELDDNMYEIYLSSGVELYFDMNGNLLYVDNDDDDYIDPANLPAAILTYIQTNYPNLTIVEAEIYDNMYVVELSNELRLYFDMNGNFLFADPD